MPDGVGVSADRRVVSLTWGAGADTIRLDQFDGTLDPAFWKSSPVAEHATAMRLSGGRVKPSDVTSAVRGALRARFGDEADKYLLAFDNNNLYFDHQALRRDRVSHEEVERLAGEAALNVPGIARFFTRTQLATRGISPADPVARRVLHGFHAARSGDVVVVQEPYKYLVTYNIVATHGAPYSYDTHVPVILMGPGLVAPACAWASCCTHVAQSASTSRAP